MVVCISDDLRYLSDELRKRGYTVVGNGSSVPCDAIICNLKYGGLASVNMQNNIRAEGTLIIDSGSKTVDEIEYILNNRVYSPIF